MFFQYISVRSFDRGRYLPYDKLAWQPCQNNLSVSYPILHIRHHAIDRGFTLALPIFAVRATVFYR